MKTADLKSLNLSIHPASLSFEGKPFYFRGSFKNFDDLNYDLSVKGELDLGKSTRFLPGKTWILRDSSGCMPISKGNKAMLKTNAMIY